MQATTQTMIQCISPIDGSVYVERPIATPEQIQACFQASRTAQANWKRLSIQERAKYCHAAVDALLNMKTRIVDELAWQMGRPVSVGAGELRGFEERARYMIELATTALADLVPNPKTGFERRILREPLGVVLTIAPWNYPFLTTVNSVIPALMAGNTSVLKHAANTLLVAERFQEAFDAAGLPQGVFQHLVLNHAQTAQVIANGLADMVCFTGSVAGGKAMEAAASGRFIPVGLELGGKDPAYVRADANLQHAIENLADGAFFNSGQSCCGIERIYAHENVYNEVVAGIAKLGSQYKLGNPLNPTTNLGPMIKPASADFVRAQINQAIAAGAVAHVDTSEFELDQPGSAYLSPQVLSNVNHSMSVMLEESFGPVVGIMKVKDDAEAIRLMNDSPYGLTAAIWTEDVGAAERMAAELQTGTVFMNRCDYLDPALAWTGVKDTGRGCTLSSIGYEALTRPKSLHFRLQTS
ncbi:aldehyde dehydrogenase family protein [uncultured Thiothrix sp.]|uniref:aldehyde dehydrogenase family protein n=1 Tax=uncultured Thiothrix sp. TaxID=223185 RepID=UPI002615E87A|nr:aldehyde dehydrogenase family protein [uncultured Thiothrix sp.]HMT91995.1 aldehyde dehydrogenase family protein [Thiolinea sp.]